MTLRACGVALLGLWMAGGAVRAQEVPLEYQVKAAYLFNFLKFVEWPSHAAEGPLTICVAGPNPFGTLLSQAIAGEVVRDRRLTTRVVSEPHPDCHVLFIPDGVPSADYLKAVSGLPTLTVGEAPGFLAQGGIINFIVEEGKVRFQIDADAAQRADLRISSHLLRLARPAGQQG